MTTNKTRIKREINRLLLKRMILEQQGKTLSLNKTKELIKLKLMVG